jgi:holo-[acyl-carrier protein] synthase
MTAGEQAAAPAGSPSSAAGRLLGEVLPAGAVVGVGIDAVDLDRFRRVLGRRRNLAERLFTAAERGYAAAAADPVPRLATRFAAKEAVMKALGVGLGAFAFVEAEVVRAGLDAPTLVLHGSALARSDAAGVARWHLSLTHTDQVAMAVALAEGGDAAGPPHPASPTS